MSPDSYDVVRSDGTASAELLEDLPRVFRGSMFPERVEWLHMADHYPSFIPLRPEEATIGPEKFLSWYPAHAGEIKTLLQVTQY